MKRISLAVLALLIAAQVPVYAESVSAPDITVSASVTDSFTITVDLRRDVSGFPDISDDATMAFGDLIPNPGNGGTTLVAEEGVVAFVTVNSHSLAYSVSSAILASLDNGSGDTIPDGAFILNSNCEDTPTGGCDEGAAGYSGTAVGTNTLYTSGGTNPMKTIQAHYYIGDDPAFGASDFVPLDQPVGTYTTTLTISATR